MHFQGHNKPITAMALSSDRSTLFTSGGDPVTPVAHINILCTNIYLMPQRYLLVAVNFHTMCQEKKTTEKSIFLCTSDEIQ